MTRINLNLATHPRRNRRFYFFLLGVAGTLLVAVTATAITIFLNYFIEGQRERASLAQVEETTLELQREEKSISTRNSEAAKILQDNVDTLNDIIMKKSFSWTEFLSRLEECLPGSSYILSLAITDVDETEIQFRFKVVSANLNDLLSLINNLQGSQFKDIRVESEEKDDRGRLLSEILVTYERTF